MNIQNPWWFDRYWAESDKHLRTWRENDIKWIPSWLDTLVLTHGSLNFVYGPRMVGKTTGLKLLIEKLLGDVDPRKILYLNVEVFEDTRRFGEALKWFIDEVSGGEGYIFLDEVSNLREWWRPVKFYIDAGVLERYAVVVTGSSTIRVLEGVEMFPGRRGGGSVVNVLPLSFPELCRVMGCDPIDTSRVRELWSFYLERGGFPISLNKGLSVALDMVYALKSEIYKLGYRVDIVECVLSVLIEKAPSPMSFNVIGNACGYSHRTVAEYIHLLEGLEVLGISYYIRGGRIDRRKEKKFFIRDPFLAKTLEMWTSTKMLEATLPEWIVSEHLYRLYGLVGYYRDGYEVDCVADGLKVEVKAGKPHRRYPRGVEVWDGDEIPLKLLRLWTSPAPR